ncbi:Spy/CpxP family protein refolding chaperone [Roseisolibacter agri]|nr:Spy/CpxP family protein refolding chaperone [Roseisolibacter agri]
MRQFTIATAAGLALVVGAATATIAQAPAGSGSRPAASDTARHDGHARGERGGPRGGERGGERGGRGGPGGPGSMLLRGITLTDAQKQQLQALRPARGGQNDAAREQTRKLMDEARAARQRGDTAAANARFTQLRTQMQQQRDRDVAAMRNVLTAEQRKQFDANVAELKQREQDRPQERGFGRGGRGGRDGQRGRDGARGERSDFRR